MFHSLLAHSFTTCNDTALLNLMRSQNSNANVCLFNAGTYKTAARHPNHMSRLGPSMESRIK